jgi:DNA-binding Lrp family transcriptional regulator
VAQPLVRLDETNRALIELLREDGRRTNQELAEQLGLPASTVRDRVRRLSEAGILSVIALTDFRALGFEFLIFLGIQIEGPPVREAAAALAKSPNTASVMVMAGKYDVWAMVALRDKKQLSDFVNTELARIDGVRDIDISIGLDVVRYDVGYGLPQVHSGGIHFQRAFNASLDDLDWRIIEELRADGRTPNRELGRRLAVSEGTVRQRLKRLEDARLIKVAGICSPAAYGKDTAAIIGVTADRKHVRNIAQQLLAEEDISFITTALGAYDLVLTLQGTRMSVFETAMNVANLEGVRRTETALMIELVKHDHTIAMLGAPTR